MQTEAGNNNAYVSAAEAIEGGKGYTSPRPRSTATRSPGAGTNRVSSPAPAKSRPATTRAAARPASGSGVRARTCAKRCSPPCCRTAGRSSGAPTADQRGMEAATFAGVLGAIMGSFLNVVAYRLPRHESLITPASHCPGCGTPVKPYDNIPVLSWLLLRGHCRSLRHPDLRPLPAGRGADRRALCRRGPRTRLGRGDRAEHRPDPAGRAGRADRPRAPDHPQRDHAARLPSWPSCSDWPSTPPASRRA